ncbi:MAG: NAD-dependent epimerase/dehydratase family protein [Parvibaculum sp.]|nr:NAD-dependent epimerase/dehydratase family protein [Parvibaculum sp.]
MRRVLVTGGSGFIGAHLLEVLAARGAVLMNVDIARPSETVGALAEWRELDILDQQSLSDTIRTFEPTAVVNLAAETRIGAHGLAFEANSIGLSRIIEAVKQYAPDAHLVHTSTQLVIGPGSEGLGPRQYDPYGPYGLSKAQSEEILWNEGSSLLWTIVRPTTVWGPGNMAMARGILRFIANGLYSHPSDPDPRRSYGYVGNVVDQLVSVLELPREAIRARVFYVGDEPELSSAWVDRFSRALRGRLARRIDARILKAAAAAGDVCQTLRLPSPINSGRLERMTADYAVPMLPSLQVLGAGGHDLDEGVARTVAWMRRR